MGISAKQVNQIALKLLGLREARKGGKTAIVTETDLTFGLARMLQILLDANQEKWVKTRVFRYMNRAKRWLCEDC